MLLFLFANNLFAQQDILVFIDNHKFTTEDFLYEYNKNKNEALPEDINSLKKEINEFIDTKLKIIEAENLGLDKTKEFTEEYNSYSKQLALSFLTDKNKLDTLTKEAYQRLKNELRIAHILIKISPYAAPEDTLIAYQKAMNIRSRLFENEAFERVAQEVSDDPSAAINQGDLWYIHAFDLPYSLENYVYKAVPGKLSQIIRSSYGYHIFKVKAYRPNPGMIKVAQIMISIPNSADEKEVSKAKKRIDDVYNKLLLGEKFEDLVKKYSDDIGVIENGELDWFGSGAMDTTFEKVSIRLQKGAFSKPFRTKYAWHIIKKLDQIPLAKYNLVIEQLKKSIYKNDRFRVCEQYIINQCKKQYHFQEETNNLSFFYNQVDSSIFKAQWQAPLVLINEPLFQIGNHVVNIQDFVDFLKNNQREIYPGLVNNYVAMQYRFFKNKIILDYACQQLEKTNADYKKLVAEYRDYVLLDRFLEKIVWNKTQIDTIAIKDFYRKNIDKYNKYSADISVFKYSSDMNIKKLKKYFSKYKKQNIKDDLLAKVISKSSNSNFKLLSRYDAVEGNDDIFDLVLNEYYLQNISLKQKIIIFPNINTLVYLNSKISKTQKAWTEFKSELINDYEEYLEKKTTENLRKKHTVRINETALKSLLY